MFSIKKLVKSFKFAFQGVLLIFRQEQNFRAHILASILVIGLGIIFKIAIWQWTAIVLLVVLIFLLEMMNTIAERLVDMLQPRVHVYAKQIKNMMSGMVLIAAIGAVIIAYLIFAPYFLELFS